MKKKEYKIGAYFILICVGVLMIYPLVWLFFATFKSNQELFGSLSLFPKEFLTDGISKG